MKIIRNLLLAIFVVAALAYLNVIIPQPQATEASTTNYNHTDSCGVQALRVDMQGDACGSFYKSGNDYTTTGKVTNTTNHTITGIQLHFKTYFCDKENQLSSSGSCTQNEKDFTSDAFSLAPGQSHTFSTPTLHSSNYGNFTSCGLFQNDFWFSYNNGSCTSTLNGSGSGFGFGGVGYCKLWDGHTLASSNPWHPQWECKPPVEQKHSECQNNACVSVNGAGTSTCSSNSDCQPQQHKTCENNACVIKAGPGASTCTQDADCQTTQTHHACVDNACKIVDGAGSDSCSTDANCQTQTHKACVSQACTIVTGGGSDSCSTDDNCKTETHRACVSNACTIVLGSGSDSCSQDSDCHVDTCSGTNCGDININVEQHQEQQQQQQQAVLGASVAPASTTTQLPSTGAGSEVLFGLLGLLPVGFKLRKFK